jgi:hypothetical protein
VCYLQKTKTIFPFRSKERGIKDVVSTVVAFPTPLELICLMPEFLRCFVVSYYFILLLLFIIIVFHKLNKLHQPAPTNTNQQPELTNNQH